MIVPAVLPFPDIDPVIFQLGPLAVHWYGAGYVVGILFGWWYARRLVPNTRLWPGEQPPITPIDIDDFLIWAALGIVLGGRIGYILFYDFQRYIQNPLDILAVWQGGMSFHGGFIGVMLGLIVFSLRRAIPMRSMFDVIACSAPVGLGLVRCTNFINSELWGRVTDVPWAFVFPTGGPEPRHPSQLYEALLEGLVLFLLLRYLSHSRLKFATPGFIAGAFVAFYGCARIFVEFFRTPDVQIGYLAGDWLTMGMVLSSPLVLLGLYLMVTAKPAQQPTAA